MSMLLVDELFPGDDDVLDTMKLPINVALRHQRPHQQRVDIAGDTALLLQSTRFLSPLNIGCDARLARTHTHTHTHERQMAGSVLTRACTNTLSP